MTKTIKKEDIKKLAWNSKFEAVKKIKYLGVVITKKPSNLMEEKYLAIQKEIQKNLEDWSKLQLSFMGRISAIKMMILPKLLFLFQNLPILLNFKYFKDLNRLTSNFLWKPKKPRIKLKLLQDLKERGGEWACRIGYYITRPAR